MSNQSFRSPSRIPRLKGRGDSQPETKDKEQLSDLENSPSSSHQHSPSFNSLRAEELIIPRLKQQNKARLAEIATLQEQSSLDTSPLEKQIFILRLENESLGRVIEVVHGKGDGNEMTKKLPTERAERQAGSIQERRREIDLHMEVELLKAENQDLSRQLDASQDENAELQRQNGQLKADNIKQRSEFLGKTEERKKELRLMDSRLTAVLKWLAQIEASDSRTNLAELDLLEAQHVAVLGHVQESRAEAKELIRALRAQAEEGQHRLVLLEDELPAFSKQPEDDQDRGPGNKSPELDLLEAQVIASLQQLDELRAEMKKTKEQPSSPKGKPPAVSKQPAEDQGNDVKFGPFEQCQHGQSVPKLTAREARDSPDINETGLEQSTHQPRHRRHLLGQRHLHSQVEAEPTAAPAHKPPEEGVAWQQSYHQQATDFKRVHAKLLEFENVSESLKRRMDGAEEEEQGFSDRYKKSLKHEKSTADDPEYPPESLLHLESQLNWFGLSLSKGKDSQTLAMDEDFEHIANIKDEQTMHISRLEMDLAAANERAYEERQARKELEQYHHNTIQEILNWLSVAKEEGMNLEADLERFGVKATNEHIERLAKWPTERLELTQTNDHFDRPARSPAGASSQHAGNTHTISDFRRHENLSHFWDPRSWGNPPTARSVLYQNMHATPDSKPGTRHTFISGALASAWDGPPSSQPSQTKVLAESPFHLFNGSVGRLTQPSTPILSAGQLVMRPRRLSVRTHTNSRSSTNPPSATDVNLSMSASENDPSYLATRRLFYESLPHNAEADDPKLSPSIEASPTVQHRPGMTSHYFAVGATEAANDSLKFHRRGRLESIDELMAPVRPLHRGRRKSLSTVDELIPSPVSLRSRACSLQEASRIASCAVGVDYKLSGNRSLSPVRSLQRSPATASWRLGDDPELPRIRSSSTLAPLRRSSGTASWRIGDDYKDNPPEQEVTQAEPQIPPELILEQHANLSPMSLVRYDEITQDILEQTPVPKGTRQTLHTPQVLRRPGENAKIDSEDVPELNTDKEIDTVSTVTDPYKGNTRNKHYDTPELEANAGPIGMSDAPATIYERKTLTISEPSAWAEIGSSNITMPAGYSETISNVLLRQKVGGSFVAGPASAPTYDIGAQTRANDKSRPDLHGETSKTPMETTRYELGIRTGFDTASMRDFDEKADNLLNSLAELQALTPRQNVQDPLSARLVNAAGELRSVLPAIAYQYAQENDVTKEGLSHQPSPTLASGEIKDVEMENRPPSQDFLYRFQNGTLPEDEDFNIATPLDSNPIEGLANSTISRMTMILPDDDAATRFGHEAPCFSTPVFYSDRLRSGDVQLPSSLEVKLDQDSLLGDERVSQVEGQQIWSLGENCPVEPFEIESGMPEDFARTASPSPGEKEAEYRPEVWITEFDMREEVNEGAHGQSPRAERSLSVAMLHGRSVSYPIELGVSASTSRVSPASSTSQTPTPSVARTAPPTPELTPAAPAPSMCNTSASHNPSITLDPLPRLSSSFTWSSTPKPSAASSLSVATCSSLTPTIKPSLPHGSARLLTKQHEVTVQPGTDIHTNVLPTSPVSPEEAVELSLVKYEPRSSPAFSEPRLVLQADIDAGERAEVQAVETVGRQLTLTVLRSRESAGQASPERPSIPSYLSGDHFTQSPLGFQSQPSSLLILPDPTYDQVMRDFDTDSLSNSPAQEITHNRSRALAALEGQTREEMSTVVDERVSSRTTAVSSWRNSMRGSAVPAPLHFKNDGQDQSRWHLKTQDRGTDASVTAGQPAVQVPKYCLCRRRESKDRGTSTPDFWGSSENYTPARRETRDRSPSDSAFPHTAGMLKWYNPSPIAVKSRGTDLSGGKTECSQSPLRWEKVVDRGKDGRKLWRQGESRMWKTSFDRHKDAGWPRRIAQRPMSPCIAKESAKQGVTPTMKRAQSSVNILSALVSQMMKYIRAHSSPLNGGSWGGLWPRISTLTLLVLVLTNIIFLISLRDHVDEWASANASPRKQHYLMNMRDEYWGSSWWSLIQLPLTAGLQGSVELLV